MPSKMTSPISPAAIPNVLPSNQAAVASPTSAPTQPIPVPGASPYSRPILSARTSSQSLSHFSDGSHVGPIRHPKPITAAQIHSELEQENEAVVNRLTRELSLLRAHQNASVVSNTSSTSAHDPDHHHPLVSPTSAAAPPRRSHTRTASNASARSITGPLSASYESRRGPPGLPLSRQNSSASRRSRTDSPGPHPHSHSHGHPHVPSDHTLGYLQQQRIPTSDPSNPALIPATPRFEEAAYYRAELDSAKRENEALKRRIRELEKLVRGRRPSNDPTSSSRPRSDSVSTTASVNPTVGSGAVIAPPRELTVVSGIAVAHQAAQAAAAAQAKDQQSSVSSSSKPLVERAASVAGSIAVGVPEEEVRVGESAADAGINLVTSPITAEHPNKDSKE